MGRFLLPEWLGISTGLTVLLIVVMALGAFWLAEKAERVFGPGVGDAKPIRRTMRLAGAGGLAVLAALVMGMGQPSPLQKYGFVSHEKDALLLERQVQIHPGELIQVAANREMKLVLLDIRNERDFNLFHLVDSRRAPLEELVRGALTRELLDEPPNAVVILVSNDETKATEAWKMLTGEGIMNLYILEGGINGWLDLFADEGACPAGCRPTPEAAGEGELSWQFDAALGDQPPIANPDLFADQAFEFTPKVKLEVKARPAGGCG
jgi:rhodanese-related sulfurtransferase